MNRLTVYDPFADVFPELFRSYSQSTRNDRKAVSEFRMDVTETDESYRVQADIPGMKKDDIHVKIDGNQVVIGAQVSAQDEKNDGDKFLRTERYRGAYSRRFSLGSEIDDQQSSARYENGVLELILPKKPENSATKLQVN